MLCTTHSSGTARSTISPFSTLDTVQGACEQPIPTQRAPSRARAAITCRHDRNSSRHCRMVSPGPVTVWPMVRSDSKISWSLPPCTHTSCLHTLCTRFVFGHTRRDTSLHCVPGSLRPPDRGLRLRGLRSSRHNRRVDHAACSLSEREQAYRSSQSANYGSAQRARPFRSVQARFVREWLSTTALNNCTQQLHAAQEHKLSSVGEAPRTL